MIFFLFSSKSSYAAVGCVLCLLYFLQIYSYIIHFTSGLFACRTLGLVDISLQSLFIYNFFFNFYILNKIQSVTLGVSPHLEFVDCISLVLLNMSCVSCELIVRCRILNILDLFFGNQENNTTSWVVLCISTRRYEIWLHHFREDYQLPVITNSLSVAKYDIVDIFK